MIIKFKKISIIIILKLKLYKRTIKNSLIIYKLAKIYFYKLFFLIYTIFKIIQGSILIKIDFKLYILIPINSNDYKLYPGIRFCM